MSVRSILFVAAGLALGSGPVAADMNFNRIASFATPRNMAEGEDTRRATSAEIIAASEDGMTLVYSDSPLGVIGLIDISDPSNPLPRGNVSVPGEPTAVSVIGNTAFVGVNTSASYDAPSGQVMAIDLTDGETLATCDLGGQPDSTAAAPDGSFIAVAIENERDEEAGDGRVPQLPGGYVALVDVVDGSLDCSRLVKADVTGLAEVAPQDPEPEFTDINRLGETVVTLQENNHVAVLDRQGKVIAHFSAGAVDLEAIDATDERAALIFDERQPGRLREPDAVQWIDDDHLAVANEGDMDGGARGWTIFDKHGEVVYEAGAAFEHAIIEAGHYPDKRSDAKGVEPEGMEFARFGGTPYVFLLAERASMVGVYDVSDPAAPVLKQLLPSGISPEGAIALPQRNLLVTANETDLVDEGGVRAHVMIYAYQDAPARYPTLTSAGADELIGWGALSGMVAGDDGLLYAVNDSFYAYQPRIFTIDPSTSPARIVAATDVTRAGRPAQKLDLEGITGDGSGGFYVVSEGRADRLIPHAIYHLDAQGEIRQEIAFPAELRAVAQRWAAEGITRVGNTLWIALQRPWQDDPEGRVKLLAYDLEDAQWRAVHYPLDSVTQGWVGLSEITAHGDWLYLIERDNQIGDAARIKQLTRVALGDLAPAPLGGELPVVDKQVVRDLVPDLAGYKGYVVDKVEGLAITADGTAWIVTDNDGVDDSSGETFLWSIGTLESGT
ncbi:esterase-like activity of phytase family protein [Modicisalibacter radicis]|uniref:esterase-like activity of phytase family protein n=1 Tax=Halomonas sp. EAR18 TaxID=2518972 RepID=UPI00109D21E5|nr:esterase-like activity of phytase family protein [Halomonas sp. EAR18]